MAATDDLILLGCQTIHGFTIVVNVMALFCKACALFGPSEFLSSKLGLFISTPFSKWTKNSYAFAGHANCQYHMDSVARMNGFKDNISHPLFAIDERIDSERTALVFKNRQVIGSLFEIVLLCERQVLPLRGHRDDEWSKGDADCPSDDDANLGNYIELVKFRAFTDQVLSEYLKSAPLNARYT